MIRAIHTCIRQSFKKVTCPFYLFLGISTLCYQVQQFTDDTAMARQIAISFIDSKGFQYKVG